MQKSYNCPNGDHVAFIVLNTPDQLQCLHYAFQWEFEPLLSDAEKRRTGLSLKHRGKIVHKIRNRGAAGSGRSVRKPSVAR